MSRFVDSNELKQIDIGNGDWVKVPARFSYGFVQQFSEAQGSDIEKISGFLLQMIKEWNLKIGDEIVPIDNPHIKMLDVETFRLILEELTKLISLPKAELPPSDKG